MPCKEKITTGYENNMNQINTVSWENTEFLNNSVSVIYTGLFEMIVWVLTTYSVDVCRITKGAHIEHL